MTPEERAAADINEMLDVAEKLTVRLREALDWCEKVEPYNFEKFDREGRYYAMTVANLINRLRDLAATP